MKSPNLKKRRAIISAMPEEFDAIKRKMRIEEQYSKGGRTFLVGKLFNQAIVLVFSRWGKVASASTSVQLINDFDLEEIIFTGVAGSLKPGVKIGDLVLGMDLIQHDMDASPLFPKFVIPITEQLKLPAKTDIHFERSALNALTNFKSQADFPNAKLHKGLILSGDKFVSKAEEVDELNAFFPDALCVEMEGASIAQVCQEYEVDFRILRIISDQAHDNKHIDFPKFAKSVASELSLIFFQNYFKDL